MILNRALGARCRPGPLVPGALLAADGKLRLDSGSTDIATDHTAALAFTWVSSGRNSTGAGVDTGAAATTSGYSVRTA
jgi:hypothetical protein